MECMLQPPLCTTVGILISLDCMYNLFTTDAWSIFLMSVRLFCSHFLKRLQRGRKGPCMIWWLSTLNCSYTSSSSYTTGLTFVYWERGPVHTPVSLVPAAARSLKRWKWMQEPVCCAEVACLQHSLKICILSRRSNAEEMSAMTQISCALSRWKWNLNAKWRLHVCSPELLRATNGGRHFELPNQSCSFKRAQQQQEPEHLCLSLWGLPQSKMPGNEAGIIRTKWEKKGRNKLWNLQFSVPLAVHQKGETMEACGSRDILFLAHDWGSHAWIY